MSLYDLTKPATHEAQKARLKEGKKFELGYVKASIEVLDQITNQDVFPISLERLEFYKSERKRYLSNV